MDLHRLPAETLADDERVLLARVGFLRALEPDPRLSAFFANLDRTTGLLAAADRFAPLATALASRIGFLHRSDLWLKAPADVASAIDAVPVTSEYQILLADTQGAQMNAMRAFVNLDAPIVAAELELFVRELGAPWRWLALELVQWYIALFVSRVYGHRVERDQSVVIGLGAGVSLQPHPGEHPAAAFQRGYATLASAAQRYLTTQRRNKQAGPKTDGRHLERWADAFYRLRVKAPADPIYRVAKAQATTPSNIKRGLRKVEPLLDVPGERLLPPG